MGSGHSGQQPDGTDGNGDPAAAHHAAVPAPPPQPPAAPPRVSPSAAFPAQAGGGSVGGAQPGPQSAPPMPAGTPTADAALAEWLRAPRPEAEPGIWRLRHRPRPPESPDQVGDRQLFGGALLALLVGLLVWSLVMNNYPPVVGWIYALLPRSLWSSTVISYLVYLVIAAPILYFAGRGGRWPELWRRRIAPLLRRPDGSRGTGPASPPAAGSSASGGADPAHWEGLRVAGATAAADLLTAEVHSGRMNDVDHARLLRSWESVRTHPERLTAFTDEVLRRGSAACAHPSGARDLPLRTATHDLVTGQVRLGEAADEKRNPHTHRGAGLALDAGVLGTSLLAVGPSGAGKTSKIVRPLVENLSLQALAGRAAVVAVGAAGAGLGPDEAYDLVIRPGSGEPGPGLDLYSGTTDPDEAAALLAEALTGDDPHAETRRAATVLAQLIGPYRVAHGHFPSVPELRELLDGVPVALASLRDACTESGGQAAGAALRELDARERQSGRPGDPATVLADRVALLDRPVFAGCFATGPGADPFSLRALDRPVRVRIDLPERAHADAARLLARLLLAQFTASVLVRTDHSLFACLVLDDAEHTLTASSVRAVQRLRTANAGVVLGLRTLEDIPQQLRAAALGAVGCRVALSGVSTWDGEVFARSWGQDWVETEDVTHTPDFHGGLITRWVRGIRTLFTGRRTTTKSVTVRTVQRERWSASDLANTLQPGHAVLSLMNVRGERTAPILARLGE